MLAFDFNGRIRPADATDEAAGETIQQLGLNDGDKAVTGLT